jgi:hypothetical protein
MRLPVPLIRASIDDCLKQFFDRIVPSREADLTQNFADNRRRDRSTLRTMLLCFEEAPACSG